MATQRTHSPYSSRSTSPETHGERYDDPFVDAPPGSLEMSHLSRHSPEGGDSYNSRRAPSMGKASPRSPPLGSNYRSRTYGTNSQYVPLAEQNTSYTPTPGIVPADSIYSIGSLNRYKTMDPDTQALVDRRAGEIAPRGIHWITPALIAALFIAGVAGALGHHYFYRRLDGQPADDQLKMIRYGTAFAFFVKSTLVGTVIMCYRQRIWQTFRKKAMTINAIDGLFSATEDPSQFFYNFEMIRNGKFATFMAACSWLIPIASVLSPASLTAEVRTSSEFTTCASVASLNFSHESLYDFRNETFYPGSSLAFYNTTDRDAKTPGWFDYYDQPSKNARRLAVTSAYLKKPATNPASSLDSCGEGWNCTYTIAFDGPGYKCDESEASDAAPFNTSDLAPLGDHLYKSSVDLGDYRNPQTEHNDDGTPKDGPPFLESLGVFDAEPVLWIGYAINTSTPYEASSPFAEKWKTVHEAKIFKCVAHHTKYTFEVRYNDTLQITRRLSRDFASPIVDTTVTGDPESLTIAPVDKYISPRTSRKHYQLISAYHAMGSLLRNFLRGNIKYSAPYYVTKSDISETRLMQSLTSYPINNLMEEVQNVYEDMLITLLSEPHLVVADKQSVPCERSRTVNVYVYHQEGLWIGYAIAVVVTFGFIVVGAWAIHQNGVSSDTKFSRIMSTTRNPTIDRLCVGACLGGDPFPKELSVTKLRFGVLLEEEPRDGPLGRVEHCCFGTAGETKDIDKYGTYAGLKKYRKELQEETGTMAEKQLLLSD